MDKKTNEKDMVTLQKLIRVIAKMGEKDFEKWSQANDFLKDNPITESPLGVLLKLPYVDQSIFHFISPYGDLEDLFELYKDIKAHCNSDSIDPHKMITLAFEFDSVSKDDLLGQVHAMIDNSIKV